MIVFVIWIHGLVPIGLECTLLDFVMQLGQFSKFDATYLPERFHCISCVKM